MSATYPADWNEPPADVVDQLTHWGCFAADGAVVSVEAMNWTGAQRTEAAVRAAIRMLLANGLIEAVPLPTDRVHVRIDPPHTGRTDVG